MSRPDARDHRRREHLVGPEHPGHVGIEDLVPVGLGHVQRRHALGDPGRRYDDVDAAECRQARLVKAPQRRELADVGWMPQRPPPPLFDRGRHVVHRRGAASGGDHVRAGIGQTEREGASDAGRTADDDRGAAVEIEERPGHRAARRFGAPCTLNVEASSSLAMYDRARSRCSLISRRARSASLARIA
jgi:hypothetical protein